MVEGMLSQANKVSVTSVIFIGLRSPSADEHRLADDLAVYQGLHRVRCALQRKAAPDAGLELALCGQLDQGFDVGGGDLRMGFVEPADPDANRLDALDQQVVGAGGRRRAAE